MASFLAPRRHVGDEQLLALMDGELSLAQIRHVHKHLERCWNCRTRHERLQGVIHDFVNYSNEVVAPFLPPPPSGRNRFLAALDAELSSGSKAPWRAPLQTLRALFGEAMNPVFLTVVIVALAAAVLTMVWHRAATPQPTSAQFLARAVRSEHLSRQQQGVAYQKVEIRAPHRLLERSIYRDLSGHRTPVQPALSPADAAIKLRLESAGVDWQDPLSPADFQAWHSRVHVLKDQVQRSGPGEWTLITQTDDSAVRQASLTVRDDDFYPVARQVIFRDSEEVHIAELNHDVLPWSALNASLFEPLTGASAHGGMDSIRPALSRALLPSPAELTQAALEAQLALVKLRADAGEDIRVERGDTRVYVRGVVDTDARKEELNRDLNRLPLVQPQVKSLQEIERLRNASPPEGPVQVYSAELQPSPLETFLSTRSMPADQAALLSRTLIQSSITIEREARALLALDTQYNSSDAAGMNDESRRLLETLKQEHLTALLQALASEQSALAPYAEGSDLYRTDSLRSLSELADNNKQLSEELVNGSGQNSESAAQILHDLVHVTAQLRQTLTPTQPIHPR